MCESPLTCFSVSLVFFGLGREAVVPFRRNARSRLLRPAFANELQLGQLGSNLSGALLDDRLRS